MHRFLRNALSIALPALFSMEAYAQNKTNINPFEVMAMRSLLANQSSYQSIDTILSYSGVNKLGKTAYFLNIGNVSDRYDTLSGLEYCILFEGPDVNKNKQLDTEEWRHTTLLFFTEEKADCYHFEKHGENVNVFDATISDTAFDSIAIGSQTLDIEKTIKNNFINTYPSIKEALIAMKIRHYQNRKKEIASLKSH